MRLCIIRKLGTIRVMIRPSASASTGTVTATSQERPTSTWIAITMPPTIMIGAITISVHDISTSICTCCTSLVSRVIRLGAPKCCTSRWLNMPTRWKIAARTSRPKPMAVRAPNQTAPTEHRIWTSATPSISAPMRMM